MLRALTCVLVVSACTPPEEKPSTVPCGSQVSDGAGLDGENPSLRGVLVGTPVALSFAVRPAPGCGANSGARVFTEVMDPDNHALAHAFTPAELSPFDRFLSTVTFTPVQVGVHHASARFEPAMGARQVDVIAGRVRSPAQMLFLDTGCATIDVTASGLLLCLTDAGRLFLFRDGTLLQQDFLASAFSVAGNVVWVAGDRKLRRLVDGGGPTPLVETGSLDGFEGARGLIGAELAAIVGPAPSVFRIEALPTGALKRTGEISGDFAPAVAASPDFSRVIVQQTTPTRRGHCVGTFGATPAVTGCQAFPEGEQVMGVDATGLFLRGQGLIAHLGFDAAGNLLREAIPVPRAGDTSGTLHFGDLPVVPTSLLPALVTFGPDGLALEPVSPPAGQVLRPSPLARIHAEGKLGVHAIYAP